MSPFDRLGLDWDADESQVKRAYARALKTTRPDDDAHAFQSLNEAYQRALAHARACAAGEWDDDDVAVDDVAVEDDASGDTDAGFAWGSRALRESRDRPVPAPQPPAGWVSADAPMAGMLEPSNEAVPDHARFDFAAFYRELTECAARERAQPFHQWLHSLDALYDLELKEAVGATLLDWLLDDDGGVLLPAAHIGVLEQFFGLHMQERLLPLNAARWAVRHDDAKHYGEAKRLPIRQLKRRFFWPQSVLIGAMPGLPARIAALARRLIGDYGDLPRGVVGQQFVLFASLADPRYLGRWRWAVVAMRAVLAALAAVSILAMGQLLSGALDAGPLLMTAMVFAGVTAATSTVWIGFGWLRALTSDTDEASSRCALWLPVGLGALALLLATLTPLPMVGMVLAAVGVIIASRHKSRAFEALRFVIGGYWLCNLLAGAAFQFEAMACGVAIGAIVMTATDAMYARRHGLPIAAATGNRWTSIASYVMFFGTMMLRLV